MSRVLSGGDFAVQDVKCIMAAERANTGYLQYS